MTEPAFESRTAILRETHPFFRWLPLGVIATAIGLPLLAKPLVALSPMLLAMTFLSFFLVRRYNPLAVTRPGTLTADATGVSRDGVLLVPRSGIKQGFVLAGNGQWMVRLEHAIWQRPTEIVVGSIEEGRALLRALGLDASQTAATIRGMAWPFSLPRHLMLPIFALPAVGMILTATVARGLGNPALAAAMMPLVAVAMGALMIVPTRIRVGADGILTRWMGRERFYPFKDIERFAPYESGYSTRKYVGVELTLRDGKTVRLPVGQKIWSERESGLLLERVREAIEVYRAGAAGVDASALARRDRAPAEWLRSLRSLGAGAGADMRTAMVPAEQLLSVVLDSTARAIDRASAAVAIAGVLPEEDRKKIRVAAEMAASPKLRVALARATADADASDDEALSEALAELESEEKAREKA